MRRVPPCAPSRTPPTRTVRAPTHSWPLPPSHAQWRTRALHDDRTRGGSIRGGPLPESDPLANPWSTVATLRRCPVFRDARLSPPRRLRLRGGHYGLSVLSLRRRTRAQSIPLPVAAQFPGALCARYAACIKPHACTEGVGRCGGRKFSRQPTHSKRASAVTNPSGG